jgi:TonB family protein
VNIPKKVQVTYRGVQEKRVSSHVSNQRLAGQQTTSVARLFAAGVQNRKEIVPLKDDVVSGVKTFAQDKPSVRYTGTDEKTLVKPSEEIRASGQGYADYYRAVREKINMCKVHPKPFSVGEVYLVITISNNGNLKDVRVVDSRSSRNTLLREASIESVKSGNPFPPFPKGVNLSEETFPIIISYEIGGL